LRERVATWTRRRRAAGVGWRELADEIGMSWRTLMRWTSPLRAPRSSPALVPVEVVADPIDHDRALALAIVTPRGYRIEGITIADAIALVRELE
jgi:hypothetical protein